MRTILLAILMSMSMQGIAQYTNLQPDYDVSEDRESGSKVFFGQFSFETLEKEPTFDWYNSGIKEYKPDADKIAYLQKYLSQYDFIVFMGTWCDDSHNLVPKFYKVLEAADYKGEYKLYGVDRDKTTKHGVEKMWGVTLVPTFILEKKGKEVGRITETVKTSIESDLADIIQTDRGH